MRFAVSFLALFLVTPSAFAHSQTRFTREQIRDWGDVLFRAPEHPPELDDPKLSAVTSEFGPTVIPLAQLPIDSGDAVASVTPWSSWWYPKIERDLFDDGRGSSTLEKYDFVRVALTGKPSRAAAYEKKGWNPDRPHWEGLCDAWAIAATIFPEPRALRTMKLPDGSMVSFSVGDQKALLLLTADSVPASALKTYGQRFTGNADGWIFPDIFPQQLHRFVEKQLFERHRIFVMDHDPGVEVWSEPVYKASFKITALPGRTDAVAVKLWLYSATSYTDKTMRDLTGIKELVREYDYTLYGHQDGAGNLVVDSGEWIKGDLVDSRRDHPDFVYFVDGSYPRTGQNPEIDPQIVDKILGR